jgi:predicted Fe-Mo cluster-binding NifX family protein
MKLRIALAVNQKNEFERSYFGNAEKYLIYEQTQNKVQFRSEEINYIKSLGKDYLPDSEKKGKALINFLKEKNIQVLVSSDYCQNIGMLNRHFIPIRILLKQKNDILREISNRLYWITDEWNHNASEFKLFTIKSGIIKTKIEQ